MNQNKISDFIKEIRKKNNLTQKEFATKYGVTYQAVSNWEQGKNIPDIALLKQISKDNNVSIDELFDGKKNHKFKKIYIFIIIIILLIACSLIYINKTNNFEFKTITSNCSKFNISGSISYNNNKTSIFINNINYCGGDDTLKYTNIECTLYESNKDIETKISSCNYDKNDEIKLEDFLKNVNFTIDDYSRTCKKYSNESLFLMINATSNNGETTTYKIPLSLNDTCEK